MELSAFTRPGTDRYFEDYVAGSLYEYGPIGVGASEVNEFVKQFGPGLWRADGGVEDGERGTARASEWHVVGLMMRLFIDHFWTKVASIASPGVDEIKWPEPVRAGDSLSVRIRVMETRPSQSKPDRGMVRAFVETFNQEGKLVLSLRSMNLIKRRPIEAD